MSVSTANVKRLRQLGWRIRTTNEAKQALRNFQRAYTFSNLTIDGQDGPKSTEALIRCVKRLDAGLPTASAHFSFTEFRCKCGGRFTACARIWIKREAIRQAENYRKALGHGVSIVSGCRCYGHNRHVGGASQSRHMVGDAMDFPAEKGVAWFAKHNLYDGRGFNGSDGKVRHGDLGRQRSWRYA